MIKEKNTRQIVCLENESSLSNQIERDLMDSISIFLKAVPVLRIPCWGSLGCGLTFETLLVGIIAALLPPILHDRWNHRTDNPKVVENNTNSKLSWDFACFSKKSVLKCSSKSSSVSSGYWVVNNLSFTYQLLTTLVFGPKKAS